MAGLTVSVVPSSEPITLTEAKSHLRITGSGDDTLITSLIKAARTYAEEYTHRALMTQTILLELDAFSDVNDPLWEGWKTGPYLNSYKNHIVLPRPPVQSVTSVITYDDADAATTLASSKYYVDSAGEPARVVLRTGETFPDALRVANAIRVTYVAGYASAGVVPDALKIGMLQHVTHLYEHRGDMYEAAASNPPQLKSMYSAYVVYSGSGSSSLLAVG